MTLRDVHSLSKVAHCLRAAAVRTLEGNGLRAPVRGGVTHKGPDYECENCESLWVWLDATVPAPTINPPTKCDRPMQRNFIVELAYPVCTEKIGPCDDDQFNDQFDEDGCLIPDPRIGDGKCVGDSRPTIAEETQYVWAARYSIETELACAAVACVEDCAGLRCDSVVISDVAETVEGGCSFLTFNIAIVW